MGGLNTTLRMGQEVCYEHALEPQADVLGNWWRGGVDIHDYSVCDQSHTITTKMCVIRAIARQGGCVMVMPAVR